MKKATTKPLLALIGALIGALIAETANASTPTVFEQSARMPMAQAVKQIEHALKQHHFKIVATIPISKKLAKHAKAWGKAYNQNRLQGIYGIVFCNGKIANAVSDKDPAMLGACPLHLTITEKDGRATALFNRPTAFGGQSSADPVLRKLERKVEGAIVAGLK